MDFVLWKIYVYTYRIYSRFLYSLGLLNVTTVEAFGIGNVHHNASRIVLLEKLAIIWLVRKISLQGSQSSLPGWIRTLSCDDWIENTFSSTLHFAFVVYFHLLLGFQRRIYFSGLSYWNINLLNPTGHVMHQQFNIQQLYALPTLYLCVLYLSENKQRLVPLIA